MTDTEQNTEEQVDSTVENTETSVEEKSYSKSELTGIISRKEKKWSKELEDLKANYEALKTEYESRLGKSLSAEEKLSKMQEEFKRTIEKERKEKETLLSSFRESKIDKELMRATSKTTRPELVAQLLRNKVKFDAESNTVHGIGEFESPVSLDEMVANFMKDYPEFAPTPKGGSGSVNTRTQAMRDTAFDKPPKDRAELLERVKAKLRT